MSYHVSMHPSRCPINFWRLWLPQFWRSNFWTARRLDFHTVKVIRPGPGRVRVLYAKLERRNLSWVYDALWLGYCCFRSILCQNHLVLVDAFTILNKWFWTLTIMSLGGARGGGGWGVFCRHSIKLEISWPSFFKFQSMFICCNRRQERVLMPRGGIVRQRDIGP